MFIRFIFLDLERDLRIVVQGKTAFCGNDGVLDAPGWKYKTFAIVHTIQPGPAFSPFKSKAD